MIKVKVDLCECINDKGFTGITMVADKLKKAGIPMKNKKIKKGFLSGYDDVKNGQKVYIWEDEEDGEGEYICHDQSTRK